MINNSAMDECKDFLNSLSLRDILSRHPPISYCPPHLTVCRFRDIPPQISVVPDSFMAWR